MLSTLYLRTIYLFTSLALAISRVSSLLCVSIGLPVRIDRVHVGSHETVVVYLYAIQMISSSNVRKPPDEDMVLTARRGKNAKHLSNHQCPALFVHYASIRVKHNHHPLRLVVRCGFRIPISVFIQYMVYQCLALYVDGL